MKFVEIYRNLKEYLPQGDNTVEKAMQYSVLSGGKRIRPLIAIEACRICGGSVKDAMPYACAIEFIHTYSLIHDDLPSMDDDDFRRGKPTCHKVFGEANAILAGDALLTLAFNIIVKHAKPKIGVQIIEELTEAIGIDGMVGGQALDMEFKKKSKDKKLLKEINLLKTAKLFEVSTRIGGICAGASREKVKALGKFGLYFGLSFQTVDDELDGESKAPPILRSKPIFAQRSASMMTPAEFGESQTSNLYSRLSGTSPKARPSSRTYAHLRSSSH